MPYRRTPSTSGSGAYAPSLIPAAASVATLTNKGYYDPAKSLYLPGGAAAGRSLRKFEAKAKGGTLTRVLMIGDSTLLGYEGNGATYVPSGGDRLRSALVQDLGDGGSGVIHLTDELFASSTDTRLTKTGAWTAQPWGVYSPQFSAVWSSSTGTDTITYTDICDSFIVYYIKSSGNGSLDLSVDGATATNVATANASRVLGSTTVAAGKLGPHTLTIKPHADGVVFVYAVEAVKGTVGVRVTKAAHGSSRSMHASSNTNALGANDPTTSLNTLFANSPDLTVIMFGINDYNGQVGASAFSTAIQTLITKAQATGDVLLVNQWNNVNVHTPPFTDYVAALYALADSNGVPLLDVWDRWGTTVAGMQALGLLSTDGVHPTTVGYWDIGNALYAAVRHSAPNAPQELAYVERTLGTTSSTGPITWDNGTTSVTVTTGTRPVSIDWGGMGGYTGTAADTYLDLYEDGTQVARCGGLSAAASDFIPITGHRRRTPAPGSHTYQVRLVGTGAQVLGGPLYPVFLHVREV